MEALADFGTVATFSFRTLTEAIYRVWHGMFDRVAATQLAAILLGLAAGLLAARAPVARTRPVHARPPPGAPARALRLTGIRALGATLSAQARSAWPSALPVGQLIVWAIEAVGRDSVPEAFLQALAQSLALGGGAAHPGHGGGRPPRVRAPAPADAARGRRPRAWPASGMRYRAR